MATPSPPRARPLSWLAQTARLMLEVRMPRISAVDVSLHDAPLHDAAVPEGHSLLMQLSRRTRQLEILSRASQQLNAVLDVPVVLRTLVAAALELVDAESGTSGIMRDGKLVFAE